MKKSIRQITTSILIAVMLLLPGCASKEPDPVEQSPNTEGQTAPAAPAEEAENTEQTMGRYLEEEITLPEDFSYSSNPRAYLQMLESGELAILDQTAGMYLSKDGGESWDKKETPWLKTLRGAYILDLAIAPNGAVAAIYAPPSKEGEETSTDSFEPLNLYVAPDGSEVSFASPDGNNYLHRLSFGKDNRLYGYAMSGKAYEIEPNTNEGKLLFETEGLTDFVCFTEQYMIDLTSRGVIFYDTENEMLASEDQVLHDFIADTVGNEIGSYSDAFCMVMAEGEEENSIYLACQNGLYRHVIGGTTVEQVVDGSLSSMGNPMMMLAGMAVLPDNVFMVLYSDGTLCRYVYNPDIPTVPEEQVSIYSLSENYAIRQAVSLFQKQHPEVYIRYEIGLSTGSGMTSEDAIKNLNTRMMSGTGPDLLVLDGLPRASYQEKGVLMDLSEIVGNMSGEEEIFPNLIDVCKEDGKLWYLPFRFRLPVLVGDKTEISKITDLKTLADTVEAFREKEKEGYITGLLSEEQLLRTLGMNCSGAWTDMKTGKVDETKLTEFLTQAKRIYQAEIEGVEENELRTYKENYANRFGWEGAMEYFGSASSAALNIATGDMKMGMGMVYMMDGEFNMISTLAKQEENFGYQRWQGQIQNGFIPKAMIGIASGSKENELALTFFRYLYGREVQDIEVSTGFPVNRASFETLKVNPRGDGENMSIGTGSPDGDYFSLEILWCTEEDFAKVKEMVESTSNICSGDPAIEEVVYEVGQKAINGGVSVEDAVKEIVKKVAIYLAE